MGEQIIDGRGNAYAMVINSDGSINIGGITGSIVIGSVSASVDSIFVQSGGNIVGSLFCMEGIPTSSIYNNPAWSFVYGSSGTSTGMIGSSIGSIIQFIGTGSYVQTITYQNGLITSLGSWS